jgi:hypothetical protein
MIKWPQAPEINKTNVIDEAIRKNLLNMIPGCKVRHKRNFDAGAVVFDKLKFPGSPQNLQ